jgi:ABC-2 type transport system ATP-binding protein
MIEVQNITKYYGKQRAVEDLSFSVSSGEIVGLLGPNGAGKSTTIKMLTGYLAPTEGQVLINGLNPLASPLDTQSNIGYLPENAPLYPDMTVYSYLEFIGNVRNLGKNQIVRSINNVMQSCKLQGRMHQSIGTLSKGFRQRVGLAQALLHEPNIVVLDEPTTGLDPNQIIEIRELIQNLGKKHTVLLSTHILSEVQSTCDRVIILHQGEKIADGLVQDVILKTQGGSLMIVSFGLLEIEIPVDQIKTSLSSIDGVQSVTQIPLETRYVIEQNEMTELRFELLTNRDCRANIFHFALEHGLILLECASNQSDLEDVFRQLTHQPTSA